MRCVILASFFLAIAMPGLAEGFDPIRDRAKFLSLVKEKQLTRFGIQLDVREDGLISGRAFGKPVTGAWQWRSGYFCRDLFWGKQDLGPNCQAVELRGKILRFTSDRGAGQFADLELR